MKKNYKIIVIIVSSIIFISLMVLISTYKKKDTFTFLTVPYDYYVCPDKDQSIDFLVFSKEKDTPYLEKDKILESSLSVSLTKDKYQVYIEEIEQLEQVKYENDEYSEYRLQIFIPLTSEEIINLNDVYLNIEYDNEELLSLPLGSICIYNSSDNNTSLYYSTLKGVTKDYNGKKLLAGVITKLKCDKEVTIKRIIPLNELSMIDYNNTRVVLDDSIDNLLPDDYEIISMKGNDKELDLKIKNGDFLFISLKHENDKVTSQMGFKIIYEVDGITNYLIINPFRYFSNEDMYQVEKIVYETTNN